MTAVNIQHLETLNDAVSRVTGIRVRETVPDWILKEADEIVLVDLTPQALLNRLARGVIYGPVRARAALSNFFKEGTLVALRELSMRQAAHAIQTRLSAGAEAAAPAASLGNETRERLLLLVGPDPATAALIPNSPVDRSLMRTSLTQPVQVCASGASGVPALAW